MPGADYLQALRPHQWAKNILLAVPIILGHEAGDLDRLLNLAIAFVAFSLVCSAGYIANDLADLESDRGDPVRARRPLAAGRISSVQALLLLFACMAVAALLSLRLGIGFAALAVGYFCLSSLYSVWLKKLVLLDVFVLAAFYTLRIVIGAEVVDLEVSFWLLCFSVFFFLSLGLLKRRADFERPDSASVHESSRRGYLPIDSQTCSVMGVAAGYTAILVHALYINSEVIATRYSTPQLIWLQLPVLLYWISRMWLLVARGKLHVDPILFAVRDKTSVVCGFVCIGLALAAK